MQYVFENKFVCLEIVYDVAESNFKQIAEWIMNVAIKLVLPTTNMESPKVAFQATAFSRPIGLTCHPVIASTGVQWGYPSADVKHQSCHLGLGCIDDSGEVLGACVGN